MELTKEKDLQIQKGSIVSLFPLAVFLVVYLASSIIAKDFYKMPVAVAFAISAMTSLLMNRERSFNDKLYSFCRGAGNVNIMIMIMIFIFAGAFANVAKEMGAVDSTVNLGLSILPSNMMVVGIFIMACFISISIGTSVGTIVALTPVAAAVADKLQIPVALVVAAAVGGAMFGDNLSMISDTTIAAAKTQGCEMKDKFRCNFKFAVIAAIMSVIILFILGGSGTAGLSEVYEYSIVKIMPYVFVLAGALLGGNVILILASGTVLAGIVGIMSGSFDIWGFAASVSTGMMNMSEIIIITVLVAGTVEIIKENGGIDYIIYSIKSRINSETGAKFGAALLVAIVDACTANNTVAIVMAGPIAKEIGDEYGLEPKKVASILDIFSCVIQGIIPYGAQLLMASGIAGISSFAIMKYLFYPYLLGIIAVIAILLKKL